MPGRRPYSIARIARREGLARMGREASVTGNMRCRERVTGSGSCRGVAITYRK